MSYLTISPETGARIRRHFYVEHWKIGTIASQLGVHPDAVRHAIESERFDNSKPLGVSVVDPYVEFIRHTLDQHPRLRATRIYQMIRDRGYSGSVVRLRRTVARLRPQFREPFLQLHTFPGEQSQVDRAHFGHVMVGRAKRALSCFVTTLSYSRALYLLTVAAGKGAILAVRKGPVEGYAMPLAAAQMWDMDGFVFMRKGVPTLSPFRRGRTCLLP